MVDTQQKYVPVLGYSWLTSVYDPIVWLTTRERRFKTELLNQASLDEGMEVLDLGCGTGTLAIWTKKHEPGIHVGELDGDPEILSIAAKKALKAQVDIHFEQGLATELPFEDAQFD